jgi:hypothetical protein
MEFKESGATVFTLENKQGMKSSSSPTLGVAVAVVGIVLIIAGGAYALYERYVVGGTRLSTLAFNPLVDALAFVGLILLIVGVAMYYRMKNQRPVAPTTTQTGSPTSGSGGASKPSGAAPKKPGSSKQTS